MKNGPDRLILIAAVTRNGGIGLNNQLLMHLPEDLRHFRKVTMGCPVIMGRRTWDSLPPAFRPLPGRRNVVVSRNAALDCPGATRAANLPEALALLAGEARAFVIGGAQLYREAVPLADELVLTEIEAEPPADAFFPPWPREAFERVSCIPGTDTSDGHGDRPAYAFCTYRRLTSPDAA